MTWTELGAIAPTALLDARLQLHHAAQVVASAGVTFLTPEPDDSHPNLAWVDSLGALVGRVLPGAQAGVGLRTADLALLLIGDGDAVQDEFDLNGRTLEEGYAWLATATTAAGASLPQGGLARASYEIPTHPVANGGAFSTDSNAAFAELTRWFANGQSSLASLISRVSGASEVRCWPHHFDLGSLAVLATDAEGGLAKSIGLGFSPGDEGYAEPYWYVSPWPYPEPNRLPDLKAGHWHTQGHTSAILTGSDLVAGSAQTQQDRLDVFLDEAVAASRRTLAD